MSLATAIYVGISLADFAYHRWRAWEERKKPAKPPGQDIQIPRTDSGAPRPRVFGRARVRQPILAWSSDPYVSDVDDATGKYRVYGLELLYIAGIPMGSGVTRGDSLAGPKLYNVWWGNYRLPSPGASGLPQVYGAGIAYGQSVARINKYGGPGRGGGLRGSYHWFGGWTDQSFDSPPSQVGDRLAAWGANSFGNGIPGFANMMCVSFTEMPEDGANPYFDSTRPDAGGTFGAVPLPTHGFVFGESPSVPSVSFEIGTFGDRINDITGKHIFQMQNEGTDFGGDADPAEVLYVLLVDVCGYDPSKIDTASFNAASVVLKGEGLGYSRSFEDDNYDVDAFANDILEHIDGALDEDPTTGKFVLTLVRANYNPNDLPHFTRDNCKFAGGKAAGRGNPINHFVVKYENRSKSYNEDDEQDKNPANALGTTGVENTLVITRPGCKTAAVAKRICARELAANAQPLITLRVFAAREYRNLLRGQAVKVTCTNPDITDMVFRIADIDRGNLKDGRVAIDLIQDVNYVWRNLPARPPGWLDGIDAL